MEDGTSSLAIRSNFRWWVRPRCLFHAAREYKRSLRRRGSGWGKSAITPKGGDGTVQQGEVIQSWLTRMTGRRRPCPRPRR